MIKEKQQRKNFICPICREEKNITEGVSGELVHQPVVEEIHEKNPGWSRQDSICLSCLNRFRSDYVQEILEMEKGEISSLEAEVVNSLKEQELLSKNINAEFEQSFTFGQRLADRIAEFGGSWRFIITFFSVLVTWIIINSVVLLSRPFDPFPFILLNLILSCLAAIQAPIIMMSQNRQEAKDRLRAEHDYRVNLKAELEVRLLSEKMDHLLNQQWQRLLEIQEIQMELMEELIRKNHENNK
jgi:uncharacterized membrane protein